MNDSILLDVLWASQELKKNIERFAKCFDWAWSSCWEWIDKLKNVRLRICDWLTAK